jgi:hypothetical protein
MLSSGNRLFDPVVRFKSGIREPKNLSGQSTDDFRRRTATSRSKEPRTLPDFHLYSVVGN